MNSEAIKINPNGAILELYGELVIHKELLKEVRLEKKEALNEDDHILELMNEYDEYIEKLKPLKEKIKVAKEEFKATHIGLFDKENTMKKKVGVLNKKIVEAYTYKAASEEVEIPIIIGEGKKQKRLVINLDPKIKKEKID